MVREENDCVGCPTYCMHCGAKNAIHMYCDKCGEDVDNLYELSGQQLCLDCVTETLPHITYDNASDYIEEG